MNSTEAEQLIQQLFDGEIGEEDFMRLEEELALNPDLHQVYREYALLHSQLPEIFSIAKPLTGVGSLGLLVRLQRTAIRKSLAMAAAIIGVVGLVLYSVQSRTPAPILTFRSSPDTKFHVSHRESGKDQPAENALTPGSTIEVVQGCVELSFESGVKAVVSAPSNLTLVSPGRIDFHEGNAWFQVPPKAIGFEVKSPSLAVTDLGTQFGIISVPGSTEEVHVLKGKVHARSLIGLKKEETLVTGDSRRVGIRGNLEEAPPLSQPFLTELPQGLPYLHLPFDEIEGDQTPIEGVHVGLESLHADLHQSDQGLPSRRLAKGRFGNAISFDGMGDFIETNWPGLYGSQSMTLSFWIKREGPPNYAGILAWGMGKPYLLEAHQWKIVLPPPSEWTDNEAILRCSWGQHNSSGAFLSLPEGEWAHLAVVYRGSSSSVDEPYVRLFYNGDELPLRGQPVSDPPQRPADLSEARPLTIGHPFDFVDREPISFFRGLLDEVFIIEGALSPEQIRVLYEENRYQP